MDEDEIRANLEDHDRELRAADELIREDREYVERAPGLAQAERGKRILRAARELYGTAKPLLVEISPHSDSDHIIFASDRVFLSPKDYAAVLREHDEASRLDLRVMRTALV